jgi:hypothetical protein
MVNYLRRPNGVRYPRVGGTRQRRFDGIHFKPHKLPENAATPTRRVHAVLGALSLSFHTFSKLSNSKSLELVTFWIVEYYLTNPNGMK